MKKKIICLYSLILLVSTFVFYSYCWSQEFSSLRSDVNYDFNGRSIGGGNKFYVKGQKVRFDTYGGEDKIQFLIDGQKGYFFTLPAFAVMAMPSSQIEENMPVPLNYKNIPGLQYLGKETVDDRECDVYEYFKQDIHYKIWVLKDIDFPIKKEKISKDGSFITRLRNIEKNVALDDNLFILPNGVEILDTNRDLKNNSGSEK